VLLIDFVDPDLGELTFSDLGDFASSSLMTGNEKHPETPSSSCDSDVSILYIAFCRFQYNASRAHSSAVGALASDKRKAAMSYGYNQNVFFKVRTCLN